MNITRFNRYAYRWLPPVSMAVAMLGATAPAWAGEDEKTITRSCVVTTNTTKDTEGKSESISITLNDEDVKVLLNGEKLSADRIKLEGDQIILLTEDGKEMRTIPMVVRVGEGAWSLGDEDMNKLWISGVEAYDDAVRSYDDAFTKLWTTRSFPRIQYRGDYEAPAVMIGVVLGEAGDALCKHLHLDKEAVTLITDVHEGLPADEAGLEEFDVIIEIDGDEPADPKTIHTVLANKEPGDVIEVTVIQAGKHKTFDIELAPYDHQAMGGDVFFFGDPGGRTWSWSGNAPYMRFGDTEIMRMPEMNRFIFKPDGQEERIQRFVMPRIEMKMHDKYKLLQESEVEPQEDLEEVNEQLTERLAELEKKLQKLMKRLERNKE